MKKYTQLTFVYAVVLILTICAAIFGSRAVTTMVETKPLPSQHTILIDPGHGGIDGGAVSTGGLAEKEYNLQISIRLRDILNLLGWQTQMTRSTDESIYTEGQTIAQKKISDLKRRLQISEETQNPIFVSIHQNFFPDSRYSGPQVFYAGSESSKLMAQELQEAMNRSLNPGSRREHKLASGIWLMERLQCPGILIECGFLSNHQEEARLRNPDYQKKLCCVIAAALGETLRNA